MKTIFCNVLEFIKYIIVEKCKAINQILAPLLQKDILKLFNFHFDGISKGRITFCQFNIYELNGTKQEKIVCVRYKNPQS